MLNVDIQYIYNILIGGFYMIENYCCFTGLRPQKLNFKENSEKYNIIMSKCEKYIVQLIELYSVTNFISGMALGWDSWCAEEILKLKNKYDITLECAVPCKEQEKHWDKADKERYYEILNKADNIVILQNKYSDDCMLKRNHYMINKSLYIIALWDGQKGGTAKTLQYAMKLKRCITIIDPITGKSSFYK